MRKHLSWVTATLVLSVVSARSVFLGWLVLRSCCVARYAGCKELEEFNLPRARPDTYKL